MRGRQLLLIWLRYMDNSKFGELDIRYAMLASPNKRFGNFVVDTLVVYAFLYALDFIADFAYNEGYGGLLFWLSEMGQFGYTIFTIVITVIYQGLMETLTMRTVGKYITNTKVIFRDGTKPGAGTILLRTICRQIPFDSLSYLGRRVGWHDSLSKTLVVDVNIYEEALRTKNSFDEIGTI